MKLINIFTIIFLVFSLIDCQVVLNREQLAEWYPSYATQNFLGLGYRNIQSIEVGTFSNLTSLNVLYLNENQLSCLNPTTFNSLTNLQVLWLSGNKLTQIEASTFSNLKSLT
jgi:Leucine-rich repeat (LRR) protein